MEGSKTLAVPGQDPHGRKGSLDSDRSITPSQIQVCVQVGTRWDICVGLQENGDGVEAHLFKTGSSYSCPNLSTKIIKNTFNPGRPSVVETLSSNKSPPFSAGASLPLRWSTNFSNQDGRRGSLTLENEIRRSSVTSLADVEENTTSSTPPEMPLECIMSRRDSRKMHDLGIVSSAKSTSFLKVPSPSSTSISSQKNVPSPLSPTMVFPLNSISQLESDTRVLRSVFGTEAEHPDSSSYLSLPYQGTVIEEDPRYQHQSHAGKRRHSSPKDQKSLRAMESKGAFHVNRTYNKGDTKDYPDIEGKGKTIRTDRRHSKDGPGRILIKQNSESNLKGSQQQATRITSQNSKPRPVDKRGDLRGRKGGDRRPSTGLPCIPRVSSDSQILKIQRSHLFSEGNICQVTDRLFLGNIRAAYSEPLLCKLTIECIVDLSNLLPAKVPHAVKSICPCTCPLETAHQRSRLCIDISDSDDVDITQYAQDVNRFLEGSFRQAKKVLVYSYHGKSRAPAIVIQYLMMIHAMSYKKAYTLVKTAFPTISLNKGFQKTLQKLQQKLQPMGSAKAASSPMEVASLAPKTRSAWN